ncbi:MAG TPA: helix-turn-helix domain-containing protein [Eubacteriales bacterium]|jgi:AcrR family transcriptional regulator|nr:helix-turn-helix domain-containing protein [Eubacteriales bacterium]
MRKKIELNTIFEAAKKVFAEFDFKKATLQDIADELSVTNSNLYLYFEGKRELYNATICFYLEKWLDKCFTPLAAMKDPRAQFNFLLKNAVLYLLEDEALAAILKKDEEFFSAFSESPRFDKVYTRMIDELAEIIRLGAEFDLMRSFDADAAAAALLNIYLYLIIKPALMGENLNIAALEDLIKYGLFIT